eukprot:TRINITY_DN3891_c0_g1_i2.p1 TRINITY_DN3891_c0_g1~~TRINITY_DN3891_c0_g1_i2.p1  ORF type:complete len:4052 (-),score=937.52 TRINITY_DN3891_c0_g1_i2:314-12469(-)
MKCWGYANHGSTGSSDKFHSGFENRACPACVGKALIEVDYLTFKNTDVPIQIGASYGHTCGIFWNNVTDSKGVRCWGSGSFGRTGRDSTESIGRAEGSMTTIDYLVFSDTVPPIQVGVGQFHTCALFENGKVRCWGSGTSGRVGQDSTDHWADGSSSARELSDIPYIVFQDAVPVIEVISEGYSSCAVFANRRMRCWGYGGFGTLGRMNTITAGDSTSTTHSMKFLSYVTQSGMVGDPVLFAMYPSPATEGIGKHFLRGPAGVMQDKKYIKFLNSGSGDAVYSTALSYPEVPKLAHKLFWNSPRWDFPGTSIDAKVLLSADNTTWYDTEETVYFYHAPVVTAIFPKGQPYNWGTSGVATLYGSGFAEYQAPHLVRTRVQNFTQTGKGYDWGTLGSVNYAGTPQTLAFLPDPTTKEQPEKGAIHDIAVTVDELGSYHDVTTFHYYDGRIKDVHPLTSPSNGGQFITLQGYDWPDLGYDPVLIMVEAEYSGQGVYSLGCKYNAADKTAVCETPPVTIISGISFPARFWCYFSLNRKHFMGVTSSTSIVPENVPLEHTLTFFTQPTILTVNPASALGEGGIPCTLDGSSFLSIDEPIQVLFNYTNTSTVISPYLDPVTRSLNFTLPPAPGPSHNFITDPVIRISLDNGRSWSQEFTGFRYFRAESLQPVGGPKKGGTSITIKGAGFHDSGYFACRFGGSTVINGDIIDAQTAVCVSPVFAEGLTTVEISLNGYQWHAGHNPMSYTFYDDPAFEIGRINALIIDPNRAPADVSAEVVKVHGGYKQVGNWTKLYPRSPENAVGISPDFLDWADNPERCRVAGLVTPAKIESDTEVRCALPKMGPGVVQLEVSMNGVDFHMVPQALTYYKLWQVPISRASITGAGNLITITGSGFLVSSEYADMRCKFGNITTQGSPVSPNSVACVPPTWPNATGDTTTIEFSSGGKFSEKGMSFTLYPDPKVTGISPITGPVSAGYAITYHGENFGSDPTFVRCAVGTNIDINPTLVSATKITCPAPVAAGPTEVIAEISLNKGHDYTKNGLLFQYFDAFTLQPSFGPQSGGTKVTISGAGLQEGAGNVCKFGSITVPAVISSSVKAECTIPSSSSLSSGDNQFTLSYDGTNFLTSALKYFAYSDPQITQIFPVNGPLEGGTVVTLRGNNLNMVKGFTPIIRMGQSEIPASAVGSEIEFVSRAGQGEVQVEVTHNGVDYTADLNRFTYYSIASLDPSRGPRSGGTTVTLHGQGFQTTGAQVCRFGNTVTAATVVGPAIVTCVSPTRPASLEELTEFVEYSSDAVQFTNLNLTYTYYPTPVLDTVSPTTGTLTGGTNVTIYGNFNLSSVSQAKCRFASTPVPALAYDNGVNGVNASLVCQTLAGAGQKHVLISLNGGHHYHGTGSQFTYFGITELEPKSGPASGGTRVAVLGRGLILGAPKPECRFATSSVPASITNSGTGECTSPAQGGASENVTVSLTMTGETYFNEAQFKFRYYPTPKVLAVRPNFAVAAGGGIVSVDGDNFNVTMDVALPSCRFGEAVVAATSYNPASNVVVCPVPAGSGTTTLEISFNGGYHFTSDLVTFTYYDINSIEPIFAPNQNPDRLTLTGFGFSPSPNAKCRFTSSNNTYDVPATVLTTGSARCDPLSVPVTLLGAYQVRFTLHPVLSSWSSPRTFTYYLTPTLTSISPDGGPVGGGAVVTLRGTNFWDSTGILCRVGKTEITPIAQTFNPADPTILCTIPAGSGVSDVAVSFNQGHDFTLFGQASFEYHDIMSIYPSQGAAAGSTEVTLSGFGFHASPTATCRFGTVVVPATFLTAAQVKCVSPPQAPQWLYVEYSITGQYYTNSQKGNFTYFPDPVIQFLEPPSGPSYGGVVITILGSFTDQGVLPKCRFGVDVVDALGPVTEVGGNSTLRCTSSAGAASVSLELSFNGGAEFTSLDKKFSYLNVGSISPSLGPASGGTRVTLTGQGFVEGRTLCRFNTSVVAATFSTSETVYCTTPAHDNVTVSMEVSVDGVHYSNDGVQFTYYATPAVYDITPSNGPAFGGTTVVLDAFVTDTGRTPLCRFGLAQVSPTGVSYGGNTSTVTCVSPPGANQAPVEISLNDGIDWTSSGQTFQYFGVVALQPDRGPMMGGTPVILSGSGFIVGSNATCRFGNTTTAAQVLSPAQAQCFSPLSNTTDTVILEMSLDGSTYTKDKRPYTYYENPSVTAIHPATGPTQGGNQVTLYGKFNETGGKAKCSFGGGETDAHSLTELTANVSSIVCPSPAGTGSVKVELSLNGGAHFTSDGVRFQYFNLNSLTPTLGPASGGTAVTLAGIGFSPSPTTSCRFGTQYVAATVGVGQAVCISPPDLSASTVIVEFSIDNITFTSDGNSYKYYTDPVVTKIEPQNGPGQGGYPVTLSGTSIFNHGGTITCDFGTGVNVASTTVVTGATGTVVCSAPPGSGSSNVELSLNGGHAYTNDGNSFSYFNLFSGKPSLGPTAGGTEILISGTGFGPNTSPKCKFGGIVTDAVVVSSAQVKCSSPALSSEGTQQISFSGNGVDYTSETIDFDYYHTPALVSVVPASAPSGSSHPITLSGTKVKGTGLERCRFGLQELTPSTVPPLNTEGSIVCQSPSAQSGVVIVSLSLNEGADHTGEEIQFSFFSLSKVEPSSGPSVGGTSVTVSGSGFIEANRDHMRCRFGSTVVKGTYIDDLSFSCEAPPTAVGQVDVHVTTNAGASWSAASQKYTYYEVPTVNSVAPTTAPAFLKNEVWVTLTGQGFRNVPQKRCRFGDTESTNVVVDSANSMRCLVPFAAGTVDLSISFNAKDYSTINTFIYYSVLDISPRSGPYEGGTVVEVSGSGFTPAGSNIKCKFGDKVSDGTYVHQALVQCRSPPQSRSRLRMQEVPSTPASFGVSFTGGNIYASLTGGVSALFRYYIPPSATAVYPAVSHTSGGERVTVIGSGFVNSPDLTCRFGNEFSDRSMPATYINETALSCESSSHVEGNVTLYVSGNNQQFYPGPSFQFELCPPGKYAPDFTQTCRPCPPGTFSANPGAKKCEICGAEEYSAKNGSILCEPCPANTITGDFRENITRCECKKDFYHPTGKTGEACLACPPGGVCTGSTAAPYTQPGYWRSDIQDHVFVKCDDSFACEGGVNNTVDNCKQGFTGRMCAQCAEDFYMSGTDCKPCRSYDYWLVLIFPIFCVLLSFFMVWIVGKNSSASGGTIGIATYFFQVLAMLNKLDLRYPQLVRDLLDVLTAPFTFNVDILASECVLPGLTWRGKWLGVMVLPLAFGVFFAFMWLVATWWEKRHLEKHGHRRRAGGDYGDEFGMESDSFDGLDADTASIERHGLVNDDGGASLDDGGHMLDDGGPVLADGAALVDDDQVPDGGDLRKTLPGYAGNRIINAYILLLTLTYLIMSSKTLDVFDCTLREDGTWALDPQPSLICFEPWWWTIAPVGILGLAMYGIIMPVGSAYWIIRNRHRLATPVYISRYGSLYKDFKRSVPFWESFIMIQKLLMLLPLAYFTIYPEFQIASFLLIMFLTLTVNILVRPFYIERYNTLQTLLRWGSCLMLLTGMALRARNTRGEDDYTTLVTFILFVIVGGSTLAILGVIIFDITVIYWSLQKDVDPRIMHHLTKLIHPHGKAELIHWLGRYGTGQEHQDALYYLINSIAGDFDPMMAEEETEADLIPVDHFIDLYCGRIFITPVIPLVRAWLLERVAAATYSRGTPYGDRAQFDLRLFEATISEFTYFQAIARSTGSMHLASKSRGIGQAQEFAEILARDRQSQDDVEVLVALVKGLYMGMVADDVALSWLGQLFDDQGTSSLSLQKACGTLAELKDTYDPEENGKGAMGTQPYLSPIFALLYENAFGPDDTVRLASYLEQARRTEFVLNTSVPFPHLHDLFVTTRAKKVALNQVLRELKLAAKQTRAERAAAAAAAAEEPELITREELQELNEKTGAKDVKIHVVETHDESVVDNFLGMFPGLFGAGTEGPSTVAALQASQALDSATHRRAPINFTEYADPERAAIEAAFNWTASVDDASTAVTQTSQRGDIESEVSSSVGLVATEMMDMAGDNPHTDASSVNEE